MRKNFFSVPGSKSIFALLLAMAVIVCSMCCITVFAEGEPAEDAALEETAAVEEAAEETAEEFRTPGVYADSAESLANGVSKAFSLAKEKKKPLENTVVSRGFFYFTCGKTCGEC